MSAASITTTTSARLGMMLTDLRLPTVKRLAGDLCAQSDLEGWPAHRLLEALLEHEINEREARRIDRHRHESSLSPDKRLSSFDFSAVPSVSKAQVMALAEGTEVRIAGRGTIAANAVRMFRGAITARYVRVRVSTAFVGGTIKAVMVASQQTFTRMVQTVHQATAGNLNVTAAGTVTATVTPPAPATPYFVNSAASTNGALILTGLGCLLLGGGIGYGVCKWRTPSPEDAADDAAFTWTVSVRCTSAVSRRPRSSAIPVSCGAPSPPTGLRFQE